MRLVAVVALALLLGLVVRVSVPSHASVVTPFDAVPLPLAVAGSGDEVFTGGIYLNTVCGAVHGAAVGSHIKVVCRDPHQSPGFGEIEVQAPTPSGAEEATRRVLSAAVRADGELRLHPSVVAAGKPTWARTAPAWLATGACVLAFTVSVPRRRRRSARPSVLEERLPGPNGGRDRSPLLHDERHPVPTELHERHE